MNIKEMAKLVNFIYISWTYAIDNLYFAYV